MVPNVVRASVKFLLGQLDDKYPGKFKTVRNNCFSHRGVPLWPKFMLPKPTPYVMKNKNISKMTGYQVYNSMNGLNTLGEKKDSDTLAILGSGDSINELDDDDYSFLSSIDTIALNWWGVYHDFAPDFYKFELGKSIKNKWINKINKKSGEYKNTIFIYEPERMFIEGENAAETILELSEPVRNNIVDIRIIQYYLSNNKKFKNSLLPYLFPITLQNRIVHYRGSLSQAIALAYLLNYDNIILFGVDLNDSDYFFSDHPDSHKTTDQGKNKEELHSTANSDQTHGIHKYILYIRNEVFSPEGISLFIGSKESLLHPELSYYQEHPDI